MIAHVLLLCACIAAAAAARAVLGGKSDKSAWIASFKHAPNATAAGDVRGAHPSCICCSVDRLSVALLFARRKTR